MSGLVSRVLVAILLIPPVLAAAWYGGVAMLALDGQLKHQQSDAETLIRFANERMRTGLAISIRSTNRPMATIAARIVSQRATTSRGVAAVSDLRKSWAGLAWNFAPAVVPCRPRAGKRKF